MKDSKIEVLDDPDNQTPTDPLVVKGKRLYGGPQMLQLSLDGKRLYVSSSLFSPWDKQFYPEVVEHGSFILKLDVDVENGGMALDEDFHVDFGLTPDGPVLAHEMRFVCVLLLDFIEELNNFSFVSLQVPWWGLYF